MSSLWCITNNGWSSHRKTCAILTKAFHGIHTLLKGRDYLWKQSFYRDKEHSSHSNNSVTYHKQRLLISEKHMCVSNKSISFHSFTFKCTWLSFNVKLLQRKGTLFFVLSSLWHISNNGLSFQRKTCVFLTKAFHEFIHF